MKKNWVLNTSRLTEHERFMLEEAERVIKQDTGMELADWIAEQIEMGNAQCIAQEDIPLDRRDEEDFFDA